LGFKLVNKSKCTKKKNIDFLCQKRPEEGSGEREVGRGEMEVGSGELEVGRQKSEV
jgi:hypothetical protein